MQTNVIGGGDVVLRGPEDEGPHPKSDHEWWQESVTLIWWDQENNMGGFHRIGHEPNYKEGPHVFLTNSLFTTEQVYRRSEFIPMTDGDEIENGFAGGGYCKFEYVNDEAIWTLDDENVAMRLTSRDYHTPIDLWPKSGELGKDVAPDHMEVASDVNGTVTIKGKQYNINGIAFRDHGWGIRMWEKIMVYRWVVGVFDADLSVFATTFLSPDGTLSKFGLVNRNNQLIRAKDIDIVTYIEADGLTHRGGHIRLVLATDEVIELECKALQAGTINNHHGMSWLDTFCQMTYGDKVGVCDFEIANRPYQGSTLPVYLEKGLMENGLFDMKI